MEKKIFNKISKDGFVVLRSFINKKYCINLHNLISKHRGVKFYNSEKLLKKNSRFYKNNPDLNFNFLNNFDHKHVDKKILSAIPGKIINKKIIWNVNKKFLPRWLQKYEKYIMGNLNHYIKKQFQDETHFYGTYIHSDILRGENRNFITAYLYLDKVPKNRAPLEMFNKTHKLGGARWPVMIRKFDNKKYIYVNDDNTMFTTKSVATGKAGDLILFDGRLLHSTDYNTSKTQRVSLRYLIIPNKKLKQFKAKYRHKTFGLKGDHLKLLGLYNKFNQ